MKELVVSAETARDMADELAEQMAGWSSPAFISAGAALARAVGAPRDHTVNVNPTRVGDVADQLLRCGITPTISAKFVGERLAGFGLSFRSRSEAVFAAFMAR